MVTVIPGSEVAVKVTGLVNPPEGVTEIVEVSDAPAVMVRDEGEADRVKSGPVTTTITVRSWDDVPPDPNTSTW
jgi:hypothetical protein